MYAVVSDEDGVDSDDDADFEPGQFEAKAEKGRWHVGESRTSVAPPSTNTYKSVAISVLDRRNSPLHVAASNGEVALVHALLAGGASVNRVTCLGETPLHLAMETASPMTVELLLEARADALAQEYRWGDIALHLFIWNEAITRVLLRDGSNNGINAPNALGDRPLHAAAWRGGSDVLCQLVQAGALVHATGCGGESALAVAALRGHSKAVSFLQELGARITSCDLPLLSVAVEHGCEEAATLARELIAGFHGWPPNRTVRRSQAPIRDKEPSPPAGLTAAWRKKMDTMTEISRRLLVHGEPPSSFNPRALMLEGAARFPLSTYRGACRAIASQQEVLRVLAVLTPAMCAALRSHVEEFGVVVPDSVDGLLNREVSLSLQQIEMLVGRDAARRLRDLPRRYTALVGATTCASQACRELTSAAAEGDSGSTATNFQMTTCFLRRYSSDTFNHDVPWVAFHFDNAMVTVNIALSADSDVTGGKLLCAFGGAVQAVSRVEGEATVHSFEVCHGVTRMREGVRYAMIMFFA
eukprot:CAMPEP_0119357472 /NCGR_PEP_ID=MMETSP1334-20130426/5850_1 /TAXON_ID=127549 /ORGANISM="Calcidiscus leptoporus, Strain RCC1130" /LENGTH=526 /DNA_ID=CAMNT_0007371723 /DNA_START=186 /DNA_END=1766 /DNA_ORIENTATION=+